MSQITLITLCWYLSWFQLFPENSTISSIFFPNEMIFQFISSLICCIWLLILTSILKIKFYSFFFSVKVCTSVFSSFLTNTLTSCTSQLSVPKVNPYFFLHYLHSCVLVIFQFIVGRHPTIYNHYFCHHTWGKLYNILDLWTPRAIYWIPISLEERHLGETHLRRIHLGDI